MEAELCAFDGLAMFNLHVFYWTRAHTMSASAQSADQCNNDQARLCTVASSSCAVHATRSWNSKMTSAEEERRRFFTQTIATRQTTKELPTASEHQSHLLPLAVSAQVRGTCGEHGTHGITQFRLITRDVVAINEMMPRAARECALPWGQP